jgi:hypothetical protein
MAIFAMPEAAHFCGGYSGAPMPAGGSFRSWTSSLSTGRVFTEGTSDFAELRDASLREAERFLFLAMCSYRRVFSLMTVSLSAWAHVTMYYSAFFAASSLLGMYGCWALNKNRIIDVTRSSPGAQQLTIRRWTSTYGGSHKAFWDLFYGNVSSLAPWVDLPLRGAIAPVSGDVVWQIDSRNEINYDSFAACELMRDFQQSFRRSRAVSTLPGALRTQFNIMEAMLRLTASFAKDFGLETDALDLLQPAGQRRVKVRELILQDDLPELERLVRRRALLV